MYDVNSSGWLSMASDHTGDPAKKDEYMRHNTYYTPINQESFPAELITAHKQGIVLSGFHGSIGRLGGGVFKFF